MDSVFPFGSVAVVKISGRYSEAPAGTKIKISARYHNGESDGYYACRIGEEPTVMRGREPFWFPIAQLVPASRKDQAAWFKDEGKRKLEEGEAMLAKANLLEKYDSDEEEVAATLVAVMTAEGSPEEKVIKISKLLKNRVSTNLV